MPNDAMNRREFLERSALAGGLAAALPAASWARVGGANEMIRVGVVGCGPQGQVIARNLQKRSAEDSVLVTRVCDVYQPRLREAAAIIGAAGLSTMEYREVLDDPDIDAVVVATPDHWHAKISVEALEAGKAVLVETPLCHTVEQALAVREAARRTGRTFAVAARRCSDDRYWKLREAVLHERLGRVTWSQGSFCMNSRIALFNRPSDGATSTVPGNPDYLWWDRWLGHEWDLAPRIECDPERFFRYQKYYDYSHGLVSELLFGVLAPLLLTVSGAEGEQPRRAVCGGGQYNLFDGREVPDQVMAIVEYPSEHSVMLVASATNDLGLDTTVRGRYGSAVFGEKDITVHEQPGFYPEFRSGNKDLVDAGMSQDDRGRWIPDPPKGEVSFRIDPGERRDCFGNFLDAIRGEAKPACGIELAFGTMVSICMVSEAIRRERVVHWDSEAQAVSES